MKNTRLDVLLIDDSDRDARIIERFFEQIDDFDLTLHHAPTVSRGRTLLDELDVDILLLDHRLGGQTGVDLLKTLRSSGYYLPIILITGKGGEKIASEVLRAGGDDYLNKNELSPEVIKHSIDFVIQEKQLRLKEQAVESVSEGVMITDNTKPGNPIVYCNKAFEKLTGYQKPEILGRNPLFLKGEDTDPETVEQVRNALREETPFQTEILNYKKDGTPSWCHMSIDPLTNPDGQVTHFVGIQQDITEKRTHQKRIQKALSEKKLLLKEVHHRVKNNLQIIVSLLRLQSRNLADETLQALLKRTKNRIFSMARIHKHLYESDDLSHLDFGSYIRELVDEIVKSHDSSNSVNVRYRVESTQLDLDTSIPLGLIVNELVSNALEHAFDQEGGSLSLHFHRNHDQYHLTIEDDGKGMTESDSLTGDESLGFRIVKNLTEKQLRGTIDVHENNGMSVNIEIPC